MRKTVNVLVVLAAVCFVLGVLASFFGNDFLAVIAGGVAPSFSPETYWRGATGLLLFAITLLMMERTKA